MNTRKSQPNKSNKQLSKIDMDKLVLSCSSITYGEISRETNNYIKQTQLSCPLPNSKDTRPPLIKEEINKLARSWCELLLGQIQEVHNQPVPLKLKPLRI
jgi:hypothetical protein